MADVITMRNFGKMGRFGNQLFQYSFVKTYAMEHGLQAQLPPWVGNILFRLREPAIEHNHLRSVVEKSEHGRHDTVLLNLPPGALKNMDVVGYFQYHTSYYKKYDQHIRHWFTPCGPVYERIRPMLFALRQRGETVVGIHLRRGDYGRRIFYITPTQWYVDHLRKFWGTLEKPVLFIATESPELKDDFKEFNPVTVEDLGHSFADKPLEVYNYLSRDLETVNTRQFDFYPDFYMLTKCDYLLIPNSTFSFFASMLNTRLKGAWRSYLPEQRFVPYDPWDAMPLQYDKVENYPHIPGVRVDSNPYWT